MQPTLSPLFSRRKLHGLNLSLPLLANMMPKRSKEQSNLEEQVQSIAQYWHILQKCAPTMFRDPFLWIRMAECCVGALTVQKPLQNILDDIIGAGPTAAEGSITQRSNSSPSFLISKFK